MKKQIKKALSVDRRDLWDGPNEYLFDGLSSNKLKYMLKHRNRKDRRIVKTIKQILKWRKHEK